MSRIKDIAGQKFGRWTAIKRVGADDRRNALWLCKCDCGTEKVIGNNRLSSGETKSCGCLQREVASRTFKKYNHFEFKGDYVIGYTTKGEPFKIDADDYEKIKDMCWLKVKQGYIKSKINGVFYSLHRFVMNCPKGMLVDHINHDKTDNRKSNLRICDSSQNQMNSIPRNVKRKGVCYSKANNKWRANIRHNGKYLCKLFEREEDAIEQREAWERKYQGEFAYNADIPGYGMDAANVYIVG